MRRFLFVFLLGLAFPAAAFAAPPEIVDPETDALFRELDGDAIAYFADLGILEESTDGSLSFADTVTRANLVEAVAEYVFPRHAISVRCLEALDPDRFPGVSYTHLFGDVGKDAPYALHLCAAMRAGMIWGYEDGNFRPDRIVNFAEAAKIITIGFALEYEMPDYETPDWYANYLHTLRRYTVFPESIDGPAHFMRVGETREILANVSSRVAARTAPALVSTMRAQQLVFTSP